MPAGTMAPIVTVHVIEKWAAGPGNKTPTPGETVPPLCVCVCVCAHMCTCTQRPASHSADVLPLVHLLFPQRRTGTIGPFSG